MNGRQRFLALFSLLFLWNAAEAVPPGKQVIMDSRISFYVGPNRHKKNPPSAVADVPPSNIISNGKGPNQLGAAFVLRVERSLGVLVNNIGLIAAGLDPIVYVAVSSHRQPRTTALHLSDSLYRWLRRE